jgi:hypothetical protein
MIIKGSLSYDQYGRKRKKKVTKARSSSSVRTHGFHPCNTGSNPVRASSKHIPSAEPKPYTVPEDTSYKKEVSKNYTVSIAYNKGAYQVIPKDEIKHIGK